MLTKQTGRGLSRRRLLEASTFGGLAAWLGTDLLAPAARAAGEALVSPSGEIFNGSHWGAYWAKVENGRFVSLRPWEKDPHPSQTLPGVQDVLYSPTRIRYPMVRRAWLEKGPGAAPETRGTGDFVRVSWDKAIELVANEIKRVETDYGPWAVFCGTYGWRSTGRMHNCQPWLRRMMNLAGGFVAATGDYSTGASQVIMPHVVGAMEVYDQQTAYPVVLENTDLFIFWGAEPFNNNQIGSQIPGHEVYGWFQEMIARKKKMVFIDPVRTEPCKLAGAEWIPLNPQTDVAMMLGMAHTLVSEKLHDEKFLKTYTVGFEQFLPYLMGETDKTPKSAEWASAICGVPAETIKDLARRCAKGRTMLASGWSVQRQHHGEQVHWMLVTLAAMLGQIGLPGGGFGLSYHYASGGAPTATGGVVGGISILNPADIGKSWTPDKGSKTIPVARIVDMLEHPGEGFDYNGTKGKYPDVRLTYWTGGNPFHHHQDRNRQVAAWKKFETFIVQDFQWTASARFADIVLPAITTAECNDLEMVGPLSNTAVVACKKVVDPVGEALSDFEIQRRIAAKMGFEQAYTGGKDEMGWIRELYMAAANMAKGRKVEMPDFDTFWKNGIHEFQIGEAAKKYVRYGAFRDDPLLNPLGTPSGKIEIYSKKIEGFHYEDCPPHPAWMEPFERASAPGAKYKLHINTKHPPYRLHSQLGGTSLREKYAVSGREPILLNPEDAAARGIKDGDVVRVFNDRGQVLAGAKITPDVFKGTAVLSEGGWYDPVEPGRPNTLSAWGDANVLSRDIGTSKLAQATSAATICGEVEKFTGALPPVKVFSEVKG